MRSISHARDHIRTDVVCATASCPALLRQCCGKLHLTPCHTADAHRVAPTPSHQSPLYLTSCKPRCPTSLSSVGNAWRFSGPRKASTGCTNQRRDTLRCLYVSNAMKPSQPWPCADNTWRRPNIKHLSASGQRLRLRGVCRNTPVSITSGAARKKGTTPSCRNRTRTTKSRRLVQPVLCHSRAKPLSVL